MSLKNFNEESEKPWFIYRKNPVGTHSWQIFEFKPEKNNYEPIGDYVVIDVSEPIDITDKRLINLVGILNNKSTFVDFKLLTDTRVLYNIIEDTPEANRHKVVFRTYDGQGVSKENAVLTIEKGVFHEET